jgi:hypothetical protein
LVENLADPMALQKVEPMVLLMVKWLAYKLAELMDFR